jgi:hypothetical protein
MGDYSMYRGDSFRLRLQVVDDQGVAVDLTGAKAWATLKRNMTELDPQGISQVVSNGTSPGITFPTITAGILELTFPPSCTYYLPDDPVTLFYDVQVRLANGIVATVDLGTINVIPDVTRDSTSA